MLEYILQRCEELRWGMPRPLQQEPIIQAMFNLLPPLGRPFPKEKQRKWLYAMQCNLDLLYQEEDEERKAHA